MFRAHPKSAISKFINAYKSASSRLLKKEFPEIRLKLWQEQFLSQSFCLLTICIENLDMKGMSQSLNFGKSVHDNAFGMFMEMLSYKLKRQGKYLVEVDKFYPSSQLCSVCGYQNRETKDLSLREWICPHCGTRHDRDINAAVNLQKEGKRLLLNQIKKEPRGTRG